jgi:hypothetical protein
MEPMSTGEVAGNGPERDEIVFDTPSKSRSSNDRKG